MSDAKLTNSNSNEFVLTVVLDWPTAVAICGSYSEDSMKGKLSSMINFGCLGVVVGTFSVDASTITADDEMAMGTSFTDVALIVTLGLAGSAITTKKIKSVKNCAENWGICFSCVQFTDWEN